MKRFIQEYSVCIEEAPLQIYCSALVFAPTNSLVKIQFAKAMPAWIRQLPIVENDWNNMWRTLDTDLDVVTTLAFSRDGKQLASGSKDGTIELWSPQKGTLIRRLEGHSDFVRSLAFSRDRKQLASASCDGTVMLWSPEEGTFTETLKSPSTIPDDRSLVVKFLRDDKNLAVVSSASVLLWDLNPARGIGKELNFPGRDGEPEEHHWNFQDMEISPDGAVV
jgi:WD40 repeat protein